MENVTTRRFFVTTMNSTDYTRRAVTIILMILAVFCTCSTVFAVSDVEKLSVLRKVASEYIEAGIEQSDRGLYVAAEMSFLKAQQYYEFLTGQQRKVVDENLQKTHRAAMEMRQAVEAMREADELAASGDLAGAQQKLSSVRYSPYLSRAEKKFVAERIDKLDLQIANRNRSIDRLYKDSVEAYLNGDFNKARAGFVEVQASGMAIGEPGKKPGDFIARLDKISGFQGSGTVLEPVSQESELLVIEPEFKSNDSKVVEIVSGGSVSVGKDGDSAVLTGVKQEAVSTAGGVEEITGSDAGGLELIAEPDVQKTPAEPVLSRKERLMQSYARAIVSDAVKEARTAVKEGKYYRAQAVVANANEKMAEYRSDIGEQLYNEYKQKLVDLRTEIESGRSKWLGEVK